VPREVIQTITMYKNVLSVVTQVTTLLHYAGDCMASVGNAPTKKKIIGNMSCVNIAMRLHTN